MNRELGLYAICLFGVMGVACLEPTDPRLKHTDAGPDTAAPLSTGGTSGSSTGGTSGTNTGGSQGSLSTGGSSGSTGGSSGSTGGSSGSGSDGGAPKTADGGGAGGGGGDPMASFTTLYNDVIKPGCMPGCHFTNASGGLNMKDAATMFPLLVNKAANNCKPMVRVVPGDPSKSLLSIIVKGMAPGCKLKPMPEAKPMLPADQIAKIDAWIMSLSATP
jgi:hypothetical protein